jgi:23S rRNA pseudouridine1911/1915/1917 synthase
VALSCEKVQMNHSITQIELTKTIPHKLNQSRLDIALSTLLPEYSRSKIQEWIKAGYVAVDGDTLRAKDKVHTDQIININAPLVTVTPQQPQPIALDVIYEDLDIIVLNKPAGLVIHPGAGRADSTLLNALLYHYPELGKLPRAGIIHRLDKDTSGLLVVTRSLMAHTNLVSDLQERKIKRGYVALVNGVVTSGGTIGAPIGRHPVKRTHMAVKSNGKLAITHYRIIKHFPAHTYLKVNLETGRTHQIRVHLAYIGYPIVGDPTYGKGIKIPPKCSDALRQALHGLKRQALHAQHIELKHPRTGKLMKWEAKPPNDMEKLLLLLS